MTSTAVETQSFPLDWVDGFIEQIRPLVFLRDIDRLLIILPNESYKLNESGIRILKPLLSGARLESLFEQGVPPEKIREDLYRFFKGLVALLKGCLGEGRGRTEVESLPYRRPHHLLPVLSEFAVSYRCNLRCAFCYAGEKNGRPVNDLSLEQIRVLFQRVRQEAQVPSISLTGGEPTLRSDLPDIVRVAVAEKLRVNLISNGTLIDLRLAEVLKNAGLSSAQISLEGPEPCVHDSLTGQGGSFEATLAGITALQKAGIPVHTNTTLNARNMRSAREMPALAKSLGLPRLSMNLIIPSPWLREHHPDLLFSYSRIGAEVLAIRARARDAGIKFHWYSPTPYCLFNPIAQGLGGKGCAACDGLLSIDPSGQVIPCSSFFEPQGSLLEQPFAEVWKARRAAHIRGKNLAPARCHSCDDFELCEGACPLYWQTQGDAELAGCLHPEPAATAAGKTIAGVDSCPREGVPRHG